MADERGPLMDGATLSRWKKVCGLLGSEHDGERAVAAAKASEMLRAAGKTWGDVGLGDVVPHDAVHVARLLNDANMWRTLLEDARQRNTRLSKRIEELERDVQKLRGQWPGGEPPKKAKAKRKRKAPEAAAEAETLLDYDAVLRGRIQEALELAILEQRTRDFLTSVLQQNRWTDRQREAVEKTIRWAFRAGGN